MIRSAVIVAGGKGMRMGADKPKQFLPLAGKPILVHTVERFLHYRDTLRLALVLPESAFDQWKEFAAQYFSSVEQARISLAQGGKLRSHSVHRGLQVLAEQVRQPASCLVAIHDGVRPFLTTEMLNQAYEIAAEAGASVTCVKVKASIRETDSKGGSRAVDRTRFLEVQTPQTFWLDRIIAAYDKRPHDRFTDDASLYETVVPGSRVAVSTGSYDNIKITTPEDMFVAAQIWKRFLP